MGMRVIFSSYIPAGGNGPGSMVAHASALTTHIPTHQTLFGQASVQGVECK